MRLNWKTQAITKISHMRLNAVKKLPLIATKMRLKTATNTTTTHTREIVSVTCLRLINVKCLGARANCTTRQSGTFFLTFNDPMTAMIQNLTQLAKNEVYSSGMVSSLVIVLHDKFRHPVSTRQNYWKSSIIWEKICEL